MQFGALVGPSKCKWDDAFKMILMENELDLLKQLKGAGERGRTIRTFDTRLRLERLVKAGYVASQATGLDVVHYRMTKHGESALSDASRLILTLPPLPAVLTAWELKPRPHVVGNASPAENASGGAIWETAGAFSA